MDEREERGADEPIDVTRLAATLLGMKLPPECVPGVAANLALLGTHIATLDAPDRE